MAGANTRKVERGHAIIAGMRGGQSVAIVCKLGKEKDGAEGEAKLTLPAADAAFLGADPTLISGRVGTAYHRLQRKVTTDTHGQQSTATALPTPLRLVNSYAGVPPSVEGARSKVVIVDVDEKGVVSFRDPHEVVG